MDDPQGRAALKGSVLGLMPEADLDVLMRDSRLVMFTAGQKVFAKGDPATQAFYVVVEGALEPRRAPGQALARLGPGQVVGEIGAVSPYQVRVCDVVAAEPTTALEIDLSKVILDSPDLANRVMKRLETTAWKRIVENERIEARARGATGGRAGPA